MDAREERGLVIAPAEALDVSPFVPFRLLQVLTACEQDLYHIYVQFAMG